MLKSEVKKIKVSLNRADMDDACKDAYARAVFMLGIDDCGHAEDERFPRSDSDLCVKFLEYEHIGSMGGQPYNYTFESWMECCDDK